MAYGWQGEKIRLVPLDREKHLENCMQWLNDEEVTKYTLVGDFPLSRLAEEEYFARAMATGREEVTFAVETLEGEHVGMCGIHQINWRDGSAITGTIIGRRDLWGKGYGSDAVITRTRYAFEVLGLRMLRSEVFAENTASIRVLKKAGYRECGRIPRLYWKRGKFRDVVIMIAEREDLDGRGCS